MKAIIHAYSLQTAKTQQILSGELKKYILSGVYTFPLYALNEEVVELFDEKNEFVGYVAVRSLEILPKELVSEEVIQISNFDRDTLYNEDPDSLLCTVLDIIPVAEGCECEDGECDCEGGCDCKEDCKCSGNCSSSKE